MTLKELRKRSGLTQAACAEYLGLPLRTYQNYEKDEGRGSALKLKYMRERLEAYGFVDEEHGILTVGKISDVCKEVFDGEKVDYCYLFGSYAKGTPNGKSDVDLLISTEKTGLEVYGLFEDLRVQLNKKVDLLTTEQLAGNPELLNEILKYGVKIYG